MALEFLARQDKKYVYISPGALYESHVQSLVARHLDSVFPSYMGGLFEPFLKTPAGNVKPDLLLISRELNGWGLVEVEIDTHGFRTHILPQIAKLSHAEGSFELAKRIRRDLLPDLAIDQISDCLSEKPKVFLVTHGSSKDFQNEIDKLGVDALDIDIHQALNTPNDYILRVIDRSSKLTDLNAVANRSSSPMTKNIWSIENFSIDQISRNSSQVEVVMNDIHSVWSGSQSGSGVLLRQPSEMSDTSDTIKAKLFLDAENFVLHMKPTL